MWDQGGQPWQQWPLNQQQWMQSFQHQQDPSQIDWAALAQAWIAQREASGQQSIVEQPPGMMPNGQDMPAMESGPNNHGNFQGDSNFNRMWQPEWGMHQQPPHPPPDQPWMPPTPGPMDIVPPSEDSNSQDSGEFAPDNRHIFNQNNHNFGGPPDNFAVGPVNQFDYQHGAAFGPPQGGFHPPYWQPGPPGPPAPAQNRRERPPSFRDRQRSPIALPVKQEPPQIDAVKRRTLPAWIREGLEKMEREKQKKLEKERVEQQRSQLSKTERRATEDAEGGDGPRLPQRSKFDSDEEDEDAENTEAVSSGKVTRSPSPAPQEEHSEPEMTEEEKEYQMMLLTKMLLTEILLDVTDEEIYYIAKDAHRKATKAPAKQLAQSSALASLTGLGGLGGYGSGDSEDEKSDRGSESSDTDEEELQHRIQQKQEAFWRKEKEQQLLQDKQMEEEKKQTERVTKEMNEFIHREQNSLSLLEASEADGDVLNEKKRPANEAPSVLEPKREHKGKEKDRRSRSGSSSSGSSSSNSRTSSSSSSVSSSSYSSSSGSSCTSSRSSSLLQPAVPGECGTGTLVPGMCCEEGPERGGILAAMWRGRRLSVRGVRLLETLRLGRPRAAAEPPGAASWSANLGNQLTRNLQIKPWELSEHRTMQFRSYSMAFPCLTRIKTYRPPWKRLHSTSQTTVDSKEIKTFLALAHKWWDEQGTFAPLHAMNDLRVPFIRDNLLKTSASHHPGRPLCGMKIMDVGCGGGLLTEPLGRLGASVVGIDPVAENIKIAQHHKSFDPVLDKRIEYKACALEEIVDETAQVFDAVVASEVVEHVIDLEMFIQCCYQVLKPGGSLFITTVNKTQLSYALGIVFAEQVAGIVPKGTHTWEKFVSPEKLESILEPNGLSVQTVAGMLYNPFSGYWHWSENTSLNYAAHAVKSIAQEHPEPMEPALKGDTEVPQADASGTLCEHGELKP